MDFFVLFLPRSGSHMLVDALNSHPEIDCTHVDGGAGGKGGMKGHAQCNTTNVTKAIVLIRNGRDRALSSYTSLVPENHVYQPTTVRRTFCPEAVIRKQEEKTRRWLQDVRKLDNRLEIHYEDLTGNRDIREIPQGYSHKICDFLGIERRILKTKLYKPRVI